MKKFGVILSILFVFGFSLLSTNHVFAVSDVVYNFTGQPSSNTTICYLNSPDPNIPDCSQYKYIYFNLNSCTLSGSSYFQLRQMDSSDTNRVSYISSSVLLPINPQFKEYLLTSNGSGYSTCSWSATLTENNPYGGVIPEGSLTISSNGTYDVTNYASATVDVSNSSFIVDLFSKGFWGVATAIVSLIVPVFALFLIFRLVHDFFWGRG